MADFFQLGRHHHCPRPPQKARGVGTSSNQQKMTVVVTTVVAALWVIIVESTDRLHSHHQLLGSWNLELCAHSPRAGGGLHVGSYFRRGSRTQGDADISLSGSLWISQRSPEDLRDISRTCWLVHIVPEALVHSVLRWLH